MKGDNGREQQMVEIENRWKSVTDRQKWATRGASVVAKAKATKVVWFPPKPAETGKKAASTAKKATKKTTRAAKKPSDSAKKVISPRRRKKT